MENDGTWGFHQEIQLGNIVMVMQQLVGDDFPSDVEVQSLLDIRLLQKQGMGLHRNSVDQPPRSQRTCCKRITKVKQDAAKDLASIETNAEMSIDQMDARRECLQFGTGFQNIALLAPIAPLIGCYVDPETWRASKQTFHRHTTIAWEEASPGQGFTSRQRFRRMPPVFDGTGSTFSF